MWEIKLKSRGKTTYKSKTWITVTSIRVSCESRGLWIPRDKKLAENSTKLTQIWPHRWSQNRPWYDEKQNTHGISTRNLPSCVNLRKERSSIYQTQCLSKFLIFVRNVPVRVRSFVSEPELDNHFDSDQCIFWCEIMKLPPWSLPLKSFSTMK